MKSLEQADCRSEILQRIQSLSADSPRQWGKMTVGQMVCHLTDGFQMATGARPVKETSSLWSRTGLKWIALSLPLPWPKGVPTLAEVDAFRDGTPPAELANDLERLERIVSGVRRVGQRRALRSSPLFRSSGTHPVVALGVSPR